MCSTNRIILNNKYYNMLCIWWNEILKQGLQTVLYNPIHIFVNQLLFPNWIKLMKENSIPYKNSRTSKIVFLLSIIASGLWWLAKGMNVYSNTIVGAIFELLWLPVLGMLFLLPIISLTLLIKEKINVRSLYIYSILIGIASIIFMVLGK